ncbi:MAG: hypothetical protein F9K44_06460 [Hyphomicrobiaceae bacterium]|nr:MAG: hypothetical protein F9K44_06460 [Hyphomicrobiaceae bacterium]
MAKLPNADLAIIEPEKILDYLLSDSHPVGRHKAAFFKTFGFRRSNPDFLHRALIEHGKSHDIVRTTTTNFGEKFELSGPLVSPDGRLSIVRSVWIIYKGEEIPRFVTAIPD